MTSSTNTQRDRDQGQYTLKRESSLAQGVCLGADLELGLV